MNLSAKLINYMSDFTGIMFLGMFFAYADELYDRLFVKHVKMMVEFLCDT